MQYEIPQEVARVARTLENAGFEAYLVGGCVRDLLLGREPKDWDIATNAKPEEIQKVFPDSVYENEFGTVLVKLEPLINADQNADQRGKKISENPRTNPRKSARPGTVEVTTYRIEGKYTDKRHPDEVEFAKTIEEDLSRRDFTVNAIAMKVVNVQDDRTVELVDPYGGQEDIKNGVIKTVGNPDERFNEDALRLMRAVRFATELGWEIELETRRAIERSAGLLEMIAKERIRDEFIKIIVTDRAAAGVILLEELNLLHAVIPELREGLGVGQNKHHIYTVFEHNVRALDYTAKKNYSLTVRLASLLHDVGKPRVKAGDGPDSTFYNHEMVGAKMTATIMDNLRFSKDITESVIHLVRHHLFYYNVDEVTAAGVRRFLNRVGPENVDDLMKVREADRIGSGVPKAVPYKLRHLLFMIEKVKHDPISPRMLKVNGGDVMRIAEIPAGPKVGHILGVLLEEVLDDPEKNTASYLKSRIKELNKLSEATLLEYAKKAKERKNEFEGEKEKEIKEKYHVR